MDETLRGEANILASFLLSQKYRFIFLYPLFLGKEMLVKFDNGIMTFIVTYSCKALPEVTEIWFD